ncbi:MAG: hypothetical protein ACRC4W_00190 [Treponemataceae bacterium]
MNNVLLGKELATLVLAKDATEESKAIVENLWIQMADVIIKHIQANGEVNVAAGIPVATAGSPTQQTGATTGTGKGNIL